MAKLIVGSRPFDMTDWDLSDIATGTVTASSATEVDVTGSGGRFVYQITGTGFTTFDTNGFPTDGTVTGLVEDVPTKTPLTISGISISASDFMGFVNGNDATGLETAIFSGNDSFLGKAGNDVLLGFAGNDVFNLTKGGNDSANGGDGNDTFNFGAAFTAADSIDGGTGTDKVTLSGDYSAGVTFGASTMVNVETLVLAAGHNYNLTLNATTVTTGQTMTVNASALGAANQVTLDGSADAGTLKLTGGAGADTLIGGTGNDVIVGGAGDNIIDLSHGGNDRANGGSGDDTFLMGGALTSADHIDGQTGDNTLVLDGDYSSGITLSAAQILNIKTVMLGTGHDYNITIGSGSTIQDVFCEAAGSGTSVTLDASASQQNMNLSGGAGDDVLIGSNPGDVFDLSLGGDDTVTGGAGNDTFNFGSAFNGADSVNGGGGSGQNIIVLDGDYSAGITLGPNTITNIQEIELSNDGNHDYKLTMDDGNVAAGKTLLIQANTNGSFTFDGSAETDGTYHIVSAAQTNIITGGQGDDLIQVAITPTDTIDGGGGNDVLLINVDATLSAHTLTNIGELEIEGATVTMANGNVADGGTLAVSLAGGFDGRKELDGTFQITGNGAAYGGQGDDTISLSGTDNHFMGSGGADQLTASVNGNDASTFIYKAASDSTSTTYDTVTNFTSHDKFDLWFTVSAVDAAVSTGALSTASFDTDLASAIGASQLGTDHAVIFTPSAGTLAGGHFLIVDANGVAGYQAGQDLVIQLAGPSPDLSLTTANFT